MCGGVSREGREMAEPTGVEGKSSEVIWNGRASGSGAGIGGRTAVHREGKFVGGEGPRQGMRGN